MSPTIKIHRSIVPQSQNCLTPMSRHTAHANFILDRHIYIHTCTTTPCVPKYMNGDIEFSVMAAADVVPASSTSDEGRKVDGIGRVAEGREGRVRTSGSRVVEGGSARESQRSTESGGIPHSHPPPQTFHPPPPPPANIFFFETTKTNGK